VTLLRVSVSRSPTARPSKPIPRGEFPYRYSGSGFAYTPAEKLSRFGTSTASLWNRRGLHPLEKERIGRDQDGMSTLRVTRRDVAR
jgi:hypothetical protein